MKNFPSKKIKYLAIPVLFSVLNSCNVQTPLKPFLTNQEIKIIPETQTVENLPKVDYQQNNNSVNIIPLDNSGKPILTGISKEDFKIKNLKAISPDTGEEINAATGIITEIKINKIINGNLQTVLDFDGSGSLMATDPENIRKRAAGKFFELLGNEDQVSIYEFYDFGLRPISISNIGFLSQFVSSSEITTTDIKIIKHQGFTNNKNLLNIAVGKIGQRGGNPLYESIPVIINQEKNNLKKNASIIIFTDGQIPSEKDKIEKAIKIANENNVKIHVIALETTTGSVNLDDMQNITDSTDGKLIITSKADELPNVFEDVIKTLKGSVDVKIGSEFPNLIPGKRYILTGDLETTLGTKVTKEIKIPFIAK